MEVIMYRVCTYNFIVTDTGYMAAWFTGGQYIYSLQYLHYSDNILGAILFELIHHCSLPFPAGMFSLRMDCPVLSTCLWLRLPSSMDIFHFLSEHGLADIAWFLSYRLWPYSIPGTALGELALTMTVWLTITGSLASQVTGSGGLRQAGFIGQCSPAILWCSAPFAHCGFKVCHYAKQGCGNIIWSWLSSF